MTYERNKSTGTILYVEHLHKKIPFNVSDNDITAYMDNISEAQNRVKGT